MLSTTTITGQQVARSNVHGVDEVFYFPLDLLPIVRRTMRLVRPRLFIMMEAEIWPNLLRACRQAKVRTVLVNGRISSRSFPRYKLARPFFRRVLADVDKFCMQSEESARRIIEVGADRGRVIVTGSLIRLTGYSRHDRRRSRAKPGAAVFPDRQRSSCAHRRLDAEGEEEPVLEAFNAFAPRGATRCSSSRRASPSALDDVERIVRRAGWRVARRTELPVDAEPRVDVVVLDTIGELAQLYRGRDRRIRRRQPRRCRRPQHSGTRRLRQSHRLRAEHAELGEIAQAFIENRGAIQVETSAELEVSWWTCCRIGPACRTGRGGAGGSSRPTAARAYAASLRSPRSSHPIQPARCCLSARADSRCCARYTDHALRSSGAGGSGMRRDPIFVAACTCPSSASAIWRSRTRQDAARVRAGAYPAGDERAASHSQPRLRRASRERGVVVVRDPEGIRADLARATNR